MRTPRNEFSFSAPLGEPPAASDDIGLSRSGHRAYSAHFLRNPTTTTLSAPTPLGQAFLEHRDQLLRFLRARGAGDAAEDLLQEVWVKVSGARPGPIASPRAYLFSTANRLMIDHYRSATQAARRERNWAEASGSATDRSEAPSADRVVQGQEYALLVQRTLDELGPRPAAIFRRHRVDEVAQRKIAEEFGISLSTVESDLRRAYRALAELKERMDEV